MRKEHLKISQRVSPRVSLRGQDDGCESGAVGGASFDSGESSHYCLDKRRREGRVGGNEERAHDRMAKIPEAIDVKTEEKKTKKKGRWGSEASERSGTVFWEMRAKKGSGGRQRPATPALRVFR